MSRTLEDQKIDNLVVEVMAINREFILRVNTPDGKDNPKLVKAYFHKLFSDWQIAMEKIIKEIEKI